MSSLVMSRAECQEFLAGTHVAIASIPDPARGPLAIPIWYDYAPGEEVRFVTGRRSRKMPLLQAAGRMSLAVQEEPLPYRYVTVEGPVTIGVPDFERDIRRVALRYLGEQMGEAYLRATVEEHADAVLVSLRPQRWLSRDFRKFRL